jgi:hypothetical protein
LEWSEKYTALEVPFERSVVALFKFYDVLREHIDAKPDSYLTWFNQIPIASGIVSKREGKNAIDLVCRTARGIYDFVELKIPKPVNGSETPLYAAMEILKNGLLYLFTRRHMPDLMRQGYSPKLPRARKQGIISATEILEATQVTLCVLAPKYFYKKFNLAWLEGELNKGLKALLANNPVDGLDRMTFRWEHLPDRPFEITGQNGFKLDFTRNHLDLWDA